MARIIAAERQLSYHEKGRCWRKFYRGKMHYLDPRGVSKGDDAAYRAAWKHWEQRRGEIDLEHATNEASLVPTIANALKLSAAIREQVGPETDLTALGIDPKLVAALNVKRAMEGTLEGSLNVSREPKIAGLVELYVSAKRSLADAGQISRQMFNEYEHNARVFADWAGQSGYTLTDQIDAGCLDRYRQFVLKLRNPEFARKAETPQLGLVSIRKRLARLKNFIEWAFESEQLAALPRNIRGLAKLRLESHEEAEKTASELFYTVAEVRELFAAATRRTKLYILLALNCGYTQSDIATLRHAHVDWQAATITRPRHKTKGKQVHCLWPITLELLKAEATKPDKKQPGGGLMLLGQNGLPLIHESDSTTTRQDTIRMAFAMVQKTLAKQRLRQSSPELFKLATRANGSMGKGELLAIKREQAARAATLQQAIKEELASDARTFKNFRKTSANLIEQKYGDGSKLADQFLGHTQKATKRFYVDSHFDALFGAIEWLGEQYALSNSE